MGFGRVKHSGGNGYGRRALVAIDDTLAHRRYSVVIPAFNEEVLIGPCLESLAAQDYPAPFEIIVVDNNCTDRTAAIAAAMGATVVFEPERGVCQARQCGTAVAHGNIVISTDADTTFSPGWLSAIDRAFARWSVHRGTGAEQLGVQHPQQPRRGRGRRTVPVRCRTLVGGPLPEAALRPGGHREENHRAGDLYLRHEYRLSQDCVQWL